MAHAKPQQKLFVTTWGVLSIAGGSVPLSALPKFLLRLRDLGYAGIEAPVAVAMEYGSAPFMAAMQEAGMQWIAMVFSSGGAPTPGNLGLASEYGIEHPKDNVSAPHDVETHKRVWAAQVLEAIKLRPILLQITSHTGKDYFTEAEADDMLSYCIRFAKEHDVIVNHETHRGRILYSPWTAGSICARHPELRLTADFSHFSVVAEAPCDDPEFERVIAELIPLVRHVHARVGFEEGPQIPDPRGKRWAPYLDHYKRWWAEVYRLAGERGDATVTTTPEFGPPPYAWTHPHTDENISNVWDVNHYMAQEMSALFAESYGAEAAAKMAASSGGVPF